MILFLACHNCGDHPPEEAFLYGTWHDQQTKGFSGSCLNPSLQLQLRSPNVGPKRLGPQAKANGGKLVQATGPVRSGRFGEPKGTESCPSLQEL